MRILGHPYSLAAGCFSNTQRRAGRYNAGRVAMEMLCCNGWGEANTAKAQAHKKLDKVGNLWTLLGGLKQTVSVEGVRFRELFDAELVCVLSFSTAALLERGGTVSEKICNMSDRPFVEASCEALIPFVGFV